MNLPSNLFEKYQLQPVKSHRTERGDIITSFREHINQDRIGTKYKQLPVAYFAQLLSIYSDSDLYILLQKCNQAKSFTKCFWYFARPKKLSPDRVVA